MAKQPKLSIKSDVLLKKYNKDLLIPEGKKCSKTVIAIIGDEYTGKDGKQYIPVHLIQNRNDLKSGKQASKADEIFRGWGNRLVRHTENVVPSVIAEQNFEEGGILDVELAVDRSLKSFYPDQEPLMNPRTEQPVTCEGKPVYRNTRVSWEPAIHQGTEIITDKVEVEQVVEEVVEVPADEYDFEDDF